jgi:hypothetical protein
MANRDNLDGIMVIFGIFAGPPGWALLIVWAIFAALTAVTARPAAPPIISPDLPGEAEARRERIRLAFGCH